jgi:hypothetical protein
MTAAKPKLFAELKDYSKVPLEMIGTNVPVKIPKVLNKHHLKGVIPPNAKYIGRGSPYGNPFVIGVHGTREQVIARFCEEILPTLDVSSLRGCDLICFCKPKACHGDPILIKANR